MSEEIPQRLMDEAIELHGKLCTWAVDEKAIARALFAAEKRAREEERERCAKVAEEFETEYADERENHEMSSPDFWMNNSGAFAAMDIAAAIRDQRTPEVGQ